jgi:hypothetical protein
MPIAGSKPAGCWLQSFAPAADYAGAVACLEAQRRPRCFTLD